MLHLSKPGNLGRQTRSSLAQQVNANTSFPVFGSSTPSCAARHKIWAPLRRLCNSIQTIHPLASVVLPFLQLFKARPEDNGNRSGARQHNSQALNFPLLLSDAHATRRAPHNRCCCFSSGWRGHHASKIIRTPPTTTFLRQHGNSRKQGLCD